jgi:3-phenylpropionate/trans-cinnamate dioxygenase ferredoxin reductase component
MECWKNADAQGAIAARNTLGAREAHVDVSWFCSDQYELTLRIAGLPERASARSSATSAPRRASCSISTATAGLVGVSGVGPHALARDLRIGQIMIERGLAPNPAALADPATRLKALPR